MSKNVQMIIGALVALAVAPAVAEDIYLVESDAVLVNGKKGRSFDQFHDRWSVEGPLKPEANYYVTNDTWEIRGCYESTAGATNVFGGASLTLGAPNTPNVVTMMAWGPGETSSVNYYQRYQKYFRAWRCDDLHVYGAKFLCNNTGYVKMCGKTTFHAGAGTFSFYGTGFTTSSQQRGYIIDGEIASDADVGVDLYCFAKENTAGKVSRFYLQADLSQFKGHFNGFYSSTTVILNGPLVCAGATAPRADWLLLDRGCALTVYPACVQNVNCGVMVASTGTTGNFFLETDPESGDYDFLLPVTATDAGMSMTTRAVGGSDSAITLKNDLSAFRGTVIVESGALVLSDAATLPNGLRFVVKSGARLYSLRANGFTGLDVTVEDGGFAGVRINVPFDGSQTTPRNMTSLTATDLRLPQAAVSVALTQPIPFPVNTTQELVCATFRPGIVTAANFTNETAKTFRHLPNMWFKVDSGTDVDTLKLLVKPVIERIGKDIYRPFSATNTCTRRTGGGDDYTADFVWSDHLAAHPGADYIHTNRCEFWCSRVGNNTMLTFNGDSLYLEGQYSMKNGCVTFPPIYLKDATITEVAGSPNLHRYCGGPYTFLNSMTLTANEEYGKAFCYSLEGELRSAADVTLTLSAKTNGVSYVTGTNSAFLGKVAITHSKSATPNPQEANVIAIGHPQSLGGDLPAFVWNALSLARHSLIRPLTTMTLNTVNRGISVEGFGGFDIPEGVTLTLGQVLRVNWNVASRLYKEGPGTLAIARTIKHGYSGTNLVDGVNNILQIDGGQIKAVGKDGYSTLRLAFAAGTGIEVDPDATGDAADYGIYSPRAVTPAEEGGTVAVCLPSVFSVGDRPKFGATICTVPNTFPDLSATFKPSHADGFDAKVEKDAETYAASGLVRYRAVWRRAGFMVIFR